MPRAELKLFLLFYFSHQSLVLDEASQEYEALQMPSGFIYQFHLLSTWGDQYYIGLNGIEFYDAEGNKIELTDNSKFTMCQ